MLFFERDIELFVSTVSTGFTTDNTVKLAVLEGSSITYKHVIQENYNYKIEETPNRISDKIVTGFGSPEFSFETYCKPYNDTTNDTTVEKLLLYSLTGSLGTEDTNDYTLNFTATHSLPELFLFIKYDNLVYKISNAVVKEAKYKVNIDKILTISWKLIGLSLVSGATIPGTFTDYTNINNFIKCKQSNVTITNAGTIYKLPIIEGNILFKNEVTIIDRDTLDVRGTQHLGHYIKQRSSEINFTTYMRLGSIGVTIGELFNEINSDIDFNTNNIINTKAKIGYDKYIEVEFTDSFIELPVIKTKDILSSNIKITSKD